jgi:hypothetical protein
MRCMKHDDGDDALDLSPPFSVGTQVQPLIGTPPMHLQSLRAYHIDNNVNKSPSHDRGLVFEIIKRINYDGKKQIRQDQFWDIPTLEP